MVPYNVIVRYGRVVGIDLAGDVLLALLGEKAPGVGGAQLQERLGRHRRRPRSDELLAALLRLEATGHRFVDRTDGFSFTLTPDGADRAYEIGGGRAVHVRLLMADLVGYTAFTALHGDGAAHAAARHLAEAARSAVTGFGGDVAKELGDGFLAWLPPACDPLPVVRELAQSCTSASGHPWSIRAASHLGKPIRHGSDLFGGDVNLVSRLCEAARPDELVMSAATYDAELLSVRGIDGPVAVTRIGLW